MTLNSDDPSEFRQTKERGSANLAEDFAAAGRSLAHLQRVATIGQLAAEMTHEIRQPLAAIRNFSEFALNALRTGDFDDEEVQEALANIFVQAGRANQITRRVTAYVRDTDQQREQLQLSELIRDVLPILEFEAERRNVEIRIEASPDLPAVAANRIEIEQVLINLLRNAIESVAASENDERLVVVSVSADDAEVLVQVSDKGVGITNAQSEQLFARFYTTKAEGLGLGLAVSRSLVQAHGGSMWAQSNEAGGATFCFTLPKSGSETAS
jgi:C4-dicarboxylate-specific signal transduction histidine kinase